jgi:large subunit ribosomal protein L4
MALAAKLRDGAVTLIDDLKFESPKTKDMAAIIKALQLSGESLLVATAAHDVNVYKSVRNIDRVSISPVGGLNALAVLQPNRVLMTKAAIEAVRTAASEKSGGEKAGNKAAK